MLVLILGIGSAVGLIVFDVFVSIVTYPFFSTRMWFTVVIAGAVLCGITVVSHILEYFEFRKDSVRHSKEHEALAHGTVDVWEKLEALTQTRGQTLTMTAEAAAHKIARLEDKVSRYDALFWQPLDDNERNRLVAILIGVGKHTVQITAHENTDCTELARDLRDCFEQAGWTIAKVPLSGTWGSAGASGFRLQQKAQVGAFNTTVFDALLSATKGPIQGRLIDETDARDVDILVGTKRLHND